MASEFTVTGNAKTTKLTAYVQRERWIIAFYRPLSHDGYSRAKGEGEIKKVQLKWSVELA